MSRPSRTSSKAPAGEPSSGRPAWETVPSGSPFRLDEAQAYEAWRARKLDAYPGSAEELVVEVDDPRSLRPAEHAALLDRCRRANTAVYSTRKAPPEDKGVPRRLGEQLGLHRLDGNLCADDDNITALRVMSGGTRHEGYIPYTNRPLSWHTDGYYNLPQQRIRAMVLHCARDAASGGENALLDHELAYILLRDQNSEHIAALMEPQAMSIPANVENGVEVRPMRTGPVFSVDPATGTLHMRYTARKRSIEWRDDALTRAAVTALECILTGSSPYIHRLRLAPGQGIVSNNALHSRTGFEDDPQSGHCRLVYRARYYDRVAGTEFNEIYADAI